MNRAIGWYDANASSVATRYESLSPERLNAWLAHLLPDRGGVVLDVGSGSGRDAAWLAGRGYEVVAAEPSKSMRRVAQLLHPEARVRWVSDSLPDLKSVVRSGVAFDLILVNAVWMHVPRQQRPRALRKLVNLLSPGGVLAIAVRLGPEEPERGLHAVDGAEVDALARKHGAMVVAAEEADDRLGRDGIRWKNYALRLPDDGTGALPMLRHVILNDSKSSTYKLGLLRSVCRIADGSAGLVRIQDDDSVSVPFGLVALTWLRLYKPLLEADFPQNPNNIRGGVHIGFAGAGLAKLAAFSHLDMRAGVRLGAADSAALHAAIRMAANTIQRMPAHYLTYPDGSKVFLVRRPPARLQSRRPKVVDEAYLRSFGELLVPWTIWRAVQRFAVWIELALVEEWTRLMQGYADRQGRPLPRDRVHAAMAWSDPSRDVKVPKDRALQLLESGSLHCVWTGRRLAARTIDLDHCFPWSAWPCSDLWNLMPASRPVNQKLKRAKLPSAQLMMAARDRILTWWEAAYDASSSRIRERFHIEAAASLPGVAPSAADLDSFFDGALAQRTKLHRDQRVPEWDGGNYVKTEK